MQLPGLSGRGQRGPDPLRSRLTLVRHGQTSANTSGVWHGSTDTALSDVGHAQAAALAAVLPDRLASPPEAIYASDLQRARHTAQPLADAFGLPLQIEPGLREYDLGAWEGRTFRDLNKNERLYQRLDVNPDFAPPEGESPRQVVTRFLEVAHRVSALHSGRVILVSHGGAISMSLGYLLWGEHASLKHLMDNCAVTELSLSPPTLHQFNEVWGLPTE